MGLPGQRHPPGPDSKVWIVIPLGTKFDVLRYLVIRKDLLYTLVEPLRKRRQALMGAEFGTLQLFWPQVG